MIGLINKLFNNTNYRIINKRYICGMLCAALLIVYFIPVPYEVSANGNNQSGHESRIMVSIGDSYSSGEGIEPFYGQDESLDSKLNNQDWLAHRSEKSWSGRLKLPGVSGTMSEHRNENWFFAASSGAEAKHMNEEQPKTYNKDWGSKKGTKYIDPQLDIFDKLGGEKADYVTLTIGGNDAGFVAVIKSAALGSSYLDMTGLPKRLNDTWDKFYKEDGIRDHIHDAYVDIAEKAGSQARIIVAGYPQLLDKNGKGAFFSKEEANMINSAVSNFNKEINNIVSDCKSSGIKICFVSVEKAFSGHEAYSEDPYLNKVILLAKSQDISDTPPSSYSVHPNDKGAAAYAECVQKKIDQLEADNGESEWPTRTMSDERDIVLVVDTSGSMEGKPIRETKSASEKFISTVLKEDASIGIVTYDYDALKISDFSMDEDYLVGSVDNMYAGGSTNIEAGLSEAYDMLQYSNAKKKIIVLMSDGAPNLGKVGDELIDYASEIKNDDIYIYTLGFFESISSGSKSDEQKLMEAIASEGCHYEVSNADDLVFFFGDIADQLNGQKYIYIRIACPVDVSVMYKGERLNSNIERLSTRTDFGTLTFEEEETDTENTAAGNVNAETDNRIKILRLKEGPDYDIYLSGNGRGRMNYTIGFMDENGEYSDLRRFNNIKITKYTEIDTVAARNDTTVLNVDTDGDGEYDVRYRASKNGRGEKIDDSNLTYIYIVIAAAAVIALVVIIIVVKKHSSGKKLKNDGANKNAV